MDLSPQRSGAMQAKWHAADFGSKCQHAPMRQMEFELKVTPYLTPMFTLGAWTVLHAGGTLVQSCIGSAPKGGDGISKPGGDMSEGGEQVHPHRISYSQRTAMAAAMVLGLREAGVDRPCVLLKGLPPATVTQAVTHVIVWLQPTDDGCMLIITGAPPYPHTSHQRDHVRVWYSRLIGEGSVYDLVSEHVGRPPVHEFEYDDTVQCVKSIVKYLYHTERERSGMMPLLGCWPAMIVLCGV
jgi:hypothetical protein